MEFEISKASGSGSDWLLPVERHSRNVRPRGLPGGMNILYHNNGNGNFTDVSEKAGILKTGPRYAITAVSYDFDNDGWPDIYVTVDSEPSILFQNKHNGTFEDVAVMAGCAYNEDGQEQAGMGVGVGDYDGDGWLDIFKTNFSDDTPDLYHNNGDGTFTDVTFVAGLGVNTQYVCWGAGFMDYDNDGWTDIFQVNGHVYPEIEEYHLDAQFAVPRIVYRNLGDGKFEGRFERTGARGLGTIFQPGLRLWRLRQRRRRGRAGAEHERLSVASAQRRRQQEQLDHRQIAGHPMQPHGHWRAGARGHRQARADR